MGGCAREVEPAIGRVPPQLRLPRADQQPEEEPTDEPYGDAWRRECLWHERLWWPFAAEESDEEAELAGAPFPPIAHHHARAQVHQRQLREPQPQPEWRPEEET